MSSLNYGDYLATAIAAIALLATVVLVLVGVRVGSDFRSISKRIDDVEERGRARSRELSAIHVMTELVRMQLENQYKVTVTGAVSLMRGSATTTQSVSTVLAGELESYKRETDRVLLFLLLLRETREVEFAQRVSNIEALYSDEETLGFFEGVRNFIPTHLKPLLDGALSRMTLKVRKVSSRRWTGYP